MTKLSKRQREIRDELSAGMAIDAARNDGLKAAIAVDNWTKAQVMLKRVKRIADARGLLYTVTERKPAIDVAIGAGIVRIVGMLKEPTQH